MTATRSDDSRFCFHMSVSRGRPVYLYGTRGNRTPCCFIPPCTVNSFWEEAAKKIPEKVRSLWFISWAQDCHELEMRTATKKPEMLKKKKRLRLMWFEPGPNTSILPPGAGTSTVCRLVEVYWHFRYACCLRHQVDQSLISVSRN